MGINLGWVKCLASDVSKKGNSATYYMLCSAKALIISFMRHLDSMIKFYTSPITPDLFLEFRYKD